MRLVKQQRSAAIQKQGSAGCGNTFTRAPSDLPG
jgi:hypothetical protein